MTFTAIKIKMEKTIYIHNGEEIKLTCDNMWYVQLDATIRFVFLKYGVGLPPFVIYDELKQQANSNSSSQEDGENWVKYKIKII